MTQAGTLQSSGKLPSAPGYNSRQMPNMTPEMMQWLSNMIGHGQGGMNSGLDFLSQLAGGDESMFSQLEAPAMRQFQQQLGQIGTRFSHAGAGDSSYAQNAMAGAGASLSENLQSQRLNIRNQAIQSLLGMSGQILGANPYENFMVEKPMAGWEKGLNYALKTADTVAGFL